MTQKLSKQNHDIFNFVECQKGYYPSGSLCLPCPADKYKDWIGNDACKKCSDNRGPSSTIGFVGSINIEQCCK